MKCFKCKVEMEYAKDTFTYTCAQCGNIIDDSPSLGSRIYGVIVGIFLSCVPIGIAYFFLSGTAKKEIIKSAQLDYATQTYKVKGVMAIFSYIDDFIGLKLLGFIILLFAIPFVFKTFKAAKYGWHVFDTTSKAKGTKEKEE